MNSSRNIGLFCWSLSHYVDGVIPAAVLAVINFYYQASGLVDDDKTALMLLSAVCVGFWPITGVMLAFVLLCVIGIKLMNVGRTNNA